MSEHLDDRVERRTNVALEAKPEDRIDQHVAARGKVGRQLACDGDLKRLQLRREVL